MTAISKMHPGELREWEQNPRVIRDERFEALKYALAQDPDMLDARPLIATRDGVVIAGNMRLRAVVALGWEEVPVYIADFDSTDARAREWALRDNAPYGDYVQDELEALIAQHAAEGGDMALLGMEDDVLASALGTAQSDGGGSGHGGDPDGGVDDPPEDPVSKVGDVYALGAHRLVVGDMTDPATIQEVEALLGDDLYEDGSLDIRASLIFTSPPYGVGIDYGAWTDDVAHVHDLLKALAGPWANMVRDGGYCVTNFGDIIAATKQGLVPGDEPCEFPMATVYWPIFREAGWLLDTRRVWAKQHARVHSPWCIQSTRAASDWEHLWTWRKPGGDTPREHQREHSARGVWDPVALEGWDSAEKAHPAAFTRALAKLALRVYTDEGDVVLDPFGGSGTTLIAAEEIGRRAVLVELEPKWADVVIRRWREWTGAEPVKLDTEVAA